MEGSVNGGGVGTALDAHDEHSAPFLSSSPKSGELSTFAQKLFGEVFVWLASMVVFGSTINLVVTKRACTSLCGYAIAVAVISVLITSLLLFGHYLTWSTKMDRGSWFNSNTEKTFMGVLVAWWAAGVAGLSYVTTERVVSYRLPDDFNITTVAKAGRNMTVFIYSELQPVAHASDVGIFFGWLAFFGSIYTTFKAYHASKEEQLALSYSAFPYAAAAAEEEEHYANF